MALFGLTAVDVEQELPQRRSSIDDPQLQAQGTGVAAPPAPGAGGPPRRSSSAEAAAPPAAPRGSAPSFNAAPPRTPQHGLPPTVPSVPATPASKMLLKQGTMMTGQHPPPSPSRMASRKTEPPPAARAKAAPAHEPAPDQRSFDGKDIQELVRVSVEDYSDVARLQAIIHTQLSSRTTEAAKAEALCQMRQAAVANPNFTINPSILQLLKETLYSRNRLLRPCAAYAIAGYTANSRLGRSLLVGNAHDLLPRLNAMLRCKLDSMDARYAALAVCNLSMHAEHKEAVGRSGSIPLLMALVRCNLGRFATPPPMPGAHDAAHHPAAAGTADSAYGPAGVGTDEERPADRVWVDPHHDDAQSDGEQEQEGAEDEGEDDDGGGSHGGAGGGGDGPEQDKGQRSSGAGGEGDGKGGEGGGAPPARQTYILAVKPAAAHAATALVNLAELPANRQRMRDAGMMMLLEDVMASRNDTPLKERFRLLMDFMHMDSSRFISAKAEAEATAAATAALAAATFRRRSTLATSMKGSLAGGLVARLRLEQAANGELEDEDEGDMPLPEGAGGFAGGGLARAASTRTGAAPGTGAGPAGGVAAALPLALRGHPSLGSRSEASTGSGMSSVASTARQHQPAASSKAPQLAAAAGANASIGSSVGSGARVAAGSPRSAVAALASSRRSGASQSPSSSSRSSATAAAPAAHVVTSPA